MERLEGLVSGEWSYRNWRSGADLLQLKLFGMCTQLKLEMSLSETR